MRRSITVLTLAASTLAVMGAPAPAIAKTTCASYSGKTVRSNSQVRIVLQKTKRGSRLLGCDKHSGKAKTIGSSVKPKQPGGARTGARLLATTGHFAAVGTHYVEAFGGGETSTVVNIRTGKRYTVALWAHGDVVPPPGTPVATATITRAVKLTADGRAAALIGLGSASPIFGQTLIRVVAFSAKGQQRILDFGPNGSIPKSSLKISKGVVSWTKSGMPASATL